MEFTLTWQEGLIAVILATLVYLFETLFFSRRRHVAAPPALAEEVEGELARLRADLDVLRQRLDALSGAPAQMPASATDTAEAVRSPYDYAVEYARTGMIAPEIAARCGISRDEAALIVAMQRGGGQGG